MLQYGFDFLAPSNPGRKESCDGRIHHKTYCPENYCSAKACVRRHSKDYMAKHKYPEQRSATAQARPGQTPAKPTGNEVFNPSVASQGAQASAYSIERLPPAETFERRERMPAGIPPQVSGLAAQIRRNWIPVLIGGILFGVFVGWLRR